MSIASGATVSQRMLACSARVVVLGGVGFLPPKPVEVIAPRSRSADSARRTGKTLIARAQGGSSEELDFDAILMKVADKFDKLENKPVAVGYGVGALVAFFFVEWLIHLPILDILLGFPAQLLGVLLGPYLLVRYLVDKEDVSKDVETIVGKVVGLLPGVK